MPQFDLPLTELQQYKPDRQEPADFDMFWEATLSDARTYPLAAQFEPVDYGLKTIAAYDVSFAGYGGQTIKGWFMHPATANEPVPCIVEYIGYGGGRGLPYDWLSWSSAGYAHFVMDTRGQGSVWRNGDTPDISDQGSSPQVPGFLTRGILDPEFYYYRRLMTDAVRAVEAARSHPLVDSEHIAVAGISQGGGLSISTAGLDPTVKVALPDVPFLCHFRRAAEIIDKRPYDEIAIFCHTHRDKIDMVFDTLSYFDGMNFAARAQAQALFSVGLMDQTCPPSTVYAAYNHYAGKKDIQVWPFNNHEGGETFQRVKQIAFLNDLWQ